MYWDIFLSLPGLQLTHGITAGRYFRWKRSGPICAAISSKRNSPVMEPGAASARTFCLPGRRAKSCPLAGSRDVNSCCLSTSCFGQCSPPWKLPLHALQTLLLPQRGMALFERRLFSTSPPFLAGAEVLAAHRSTCLLPPGFPIGPGDAVTILTPHLAIGREYTWGHRCPLYSKQYHETLLKKRSKSSSSFLGKAD